jgi:hypothetical protein
MVTQLGLFVEIDAPIAALGWRCSARHRAQGPSRPAATVQPPTAAPAAVADPPKRSAGRARSARPPRATASPGGPVPSRLALPAHPKRHGARRPSRKDIAAAIESQR